MRITTWAKVLLVAGVGMAFSAMPARAEIIGNLELPDGFASGASNVQGWVFTNTPGAELIQPFAVLINGEEEFKVPCCGDRGDVQLLHPDAPLLSGFSGVYNWGLATATVPVSSPQGLGPVNEITVQVLVTDTMGGVKLLTKQVALFHPTSWPRSKLAQWDDELPAPKGADTPQGGPGPIPVDAHCSLSNLGYFTPGAASMVCTDLVFTAPDDSTSTCAAADFEWDKGSQSFRLTSNCFVYEVE